MSMANNVSRFPINRERRNAEARLDEALLKQTSLLATLINSRRESSSEPFLGQAELMRLVRSQQSLLSAGREGHGGARVPVAALRSAGSALNDAGESCQWRQAA